MKRRTGLVSNSSSSSFTCEVCGHEVGGYDVCLSDAEMVRCNNGHLFCNDHLLEMTDEIVRELTKEALKYGLPDDELEPKVREKLENGTLDLAYVEKIGIYDYLTEDLDEHPSSMCPICMLKVVTDDIVLKYLLHISPSSKKEVKEYIRNKFKTYDNFRTLLNT